MTIKITSTAFTEGDMIPDRYALDAVINLESGITKSQLLAAMEGHILDEGQLMGKYTR